MEILARWGVPFAKPKHMQYLIMNHFIGSDVQYPWWDARTTTAIATVQYPAIFLLYGRPNVELPKAMAVR